MAEYTYQTQMTYKMVFAGGYSKEHGDLIPGEEYIVFISLELDAKGKTAIFIEVRLDYEKFIKIRYSTLLRFARDWKMKESIFMEENHYTLRAYQKDAVGSALVALGNHQKGRNPSVICLPTGSGKSLVIAEICHQLNSPTLILQPSKEILEQNFAKLKSYGVDDIAIYSASCGKKDIGKFTYATIGSIRKKPELFNHIENILVDECFVAGTKIGDKSIEDIRVGELVDCLDDKGKLVKRKVLAVSKKPIHKKMILIKYHNGSMISTFNHPIFVADKGYIRADEIKKGDYVYQKIIVRQLPKNVCGEQKAGLQKKSGEKSLLPEFLPFSSKLGQNGKGKWLSDLLQGRFGKSSKDDSGGDRRSQSLFEKIKRQKERQKIKLSRVESVEILEQASNGRFGGREIGNYVYNLEVEQYHNYFANDILVHNCHIGSKAGSMMDKFFQDLSKYPKIVGLTATPFILQPRNRKLPNGYILNQQILQPLTRCYPCKWRKIAYNINTSELLKQKYLSPLRYVESNWKCSRLKVNTIGSDFTKDSLQEYGMESVDHIVRAIDFSLNRECKNKVLVFCPCLETANAINKIMGYPVVSGETPKKEREAILENFKNGETDVVLNYGVLTTGFDFPELDCIVCARPTLSLALWYQMVGRGFRIAHGKKECLVCDLSGNTKRLGKVETIELRKEEGGWKDEVWTSAGKVSGIPLSTFVVK